MVGWGVAAQVRTTGSTRFADANKWWTETTSRAIVRDDVAEPGTGLVCFGSFAFADEPGESMMVVPEIVVGRRGGTAWVTTIGRGSIATPELREVERPAAPVDVSFADGALDSERWMGVVAEAVSRISAGSLEKVVLARDLVATSDVRVDVRSAGCAPAQRDLSDVLDLPRRQPLRRDSRDAGAQGARTRDLTGAGRHHPSYG